MHQRHTGPQELWANQCQQAGFRDIELEPPLLPVEEEKIESKRAKLMDGARSDVRIGGFWGNKQHAFFEFRVFYSQAKRNHNNATNDLKTPDQLNTQNASTKWIAAISLRW